MKKDPYTILKHRYVTEKAKLLETLKNRESNASLRKCTSPKYLFLVDINANKKEIATAVETLYPQVKVESVNTIRTKPKQRRVRGRIGFTKRQKKAIVTLAKGDTLGEEEEE